MPPSPHSILTPWGVEAQKFRPSMKKLLKILLRTLYVTPVIGILFGVSAPKEDTEITHGILSIKKAFADIPYSQGYYQGYYQDYYQGYYQSSYGNPGDGTDGCSDAGDGASGSACGGGGSGGDGGK